LVANVNASRLDFQQRDGHVDAGRQNFFVDVGKVLAGFVQLGFVGDVAGKFIVVDVVLRPTHAVLC
jgi:hypothetical protein